MPRQARMHSHALTHAMEVQLVALYSCQSFDSFCFNYYLVFFPLSVKRNVRDSKRHPKCQRRTSRASHRRLLAHADQLGQYREEMAADKRGKALPLKVSHSLRAERFDVSQERVFFSFFFFDMPIPPTQPSYLRPNCEPL